MKIGIMLFFNRHITDFTDFKALLPKDNLNSFEMKPQFMQIQSNRKK